VAGVFANRCGPWFMAASKCLHVKGAPQSTGILLLHIGGGFCMLDGSLCWGWAHAAMQQVVVLTLCWCDFGLLVLCWWDVSHPNHCLGPFEAWGWGVPDCFVPFFLALVVIARVTFGAVLCSVVFCWCCCCCWLLDIVAWWLVVFCYLSIVLGVYSLAGLFWC